MTSLQRGGLPPRRIAAIVGALASAVLSGLFLLPTADIALDGAGGAGSTLGFSYGPGFFFGVAVAVVLFTYDRLPVGRCALWAVASIVAWRIALEISMQSFTVGDDPAGGTTFLGVLLAFVIPGAIGGALLAVTHVLVTARPAERWVAWLAAAGGALGVAMYLISLTVGDGGTALLIAMFAIWQVGIGVMLDAWPPAAPRPTRPSD